MYSTVEMVKQKAGITSIIQMADEAAVKYDSNTYIMLKEKIQNIKKNILIIAESKHMGIVNRLLWECRNVSAVLYSDIDNPYEIEESVTKKDRLLWDVQAHNSQTQAAMSGWLNSYNNEEFTDEELQEYVENSRQKLLPYMNENSKVLEVGIGSGMIAMKLAPLCKSYTGCDISKIVLDKLKELADKSEVDNIQLYPYSADEIDRIPDKFNIILMSSVTEYFSGYNYLRKVIERCIRQIDGKGVILFADIFDLAKKEEYRESVYRYAESHKGCRYKRDFSHELFVPHEYWKDIANQFPEITKTVISDKIGRCKNEINTFRYDVIFEIDCHKKGRDEMPLYKYQFAENGFSYDA